MAETVLEVLAEKAVELKLEDLPQNVVEKARISLLDALECCIGTVRDEKYYGTYNAVEKHFDGGADLPHTVSLFGESGCAGMRDAVFFNTVSGSISARNDIHRAGSSHPGETVVPAAMAAAEASHADGKKLLEAIVLGYESMIRLGKALKSGTKPASASLRRAALPVPMAIALTTAKIMGLSESETMSAAALSCNHLCGLNEWRNQGTGEDVFQNAWAASNGIFSAQLAKTGIPGACTNLEGGYGLLSVFGAEECASAVIEGFGEKFMMLDTMNKPVAACLSIQAPCQLAQDLLDDPAFSLDELDHIDVHVSSHIMEAPWYGKKDIDNQVSAILSVPYGIASVLAAGNIDLIKWVPPYDGKIKELMDKCELIYDDYSRENLEPGGFTVTACMAYGRKIEKTRLEFQPLTDEQVKQKFTGTMSRYFGEETAAKMLAMAEDIENVADVAEFAALFRKQNG